MADVPLLDRLVAVVTGGGRGIGRAEALRLAAYGARVVVNDAGVAIDGSPTDESPAADVVAEIAAAGGEAVADGHDISTVEGAEATVGVALATWGRVDVVVNNAGIGRPRMVFNLEEDEWDDVVRVHLKGTFAVTRAACRHWRAEAKAGHPVAGRVVNTATGLLLSGGAGQSNYVAAKAGVAAFTAAVATEMEKYGVTVNAIMPAAMTRMAAVGWRMAAAAGEGGYDRTDPTHVAELVCFLASPAAAWVSGQCFSVQGGQVVHVVPWQPAEELRRDDRGWTATELVREMPRMFGAGAPPADPPPADWSARHRARGSRAGTRPGGR